EQQGYTRIFRKRGRAIEVAQDRVRLKAGNRARLTEALEAAFLRGQGHLAVYPMAERSVSADSSRASPLPQQNAPSPSHGEGRGEGSPARRYSTGLHCAHCDIDYTPPTPALFSFNSPAGACPTCKGFGRTQGIDYGLVIPDESLSLSGGAIKPFQSKSFKSCQRDLIRYAKQKRVPIHKPWRELSDKHKRWVIEGDGGWRQRVWYGVERYFRWLERKS